MPAKSASKMPKSSKLSAKPAKRAVAKKPAGSRKAPAPPKKRARKEEQEPELAREEEDDPDLENEDDSEPEPEPEEQEVVSESEAEEEDEDTAAKRQRRERARRKKARLTGYRSLAKQAGFCAGSGASAGRDSTAPLLSLSEAQRFMRFVPPTPGSTSFGHDEFAQRLNLFKKSVPLSAAKETQARLDAAMRHLMNEAVLRTAEAGKASVTAATMASVLRPYSKRTLFTSVVPPLGLLRHAQQQGMLNVPEADKDAIAEEKKDNSKSKKLWEEFVKSEEARKEERRAAKAAKPTEAAQAAEVAA